MHRVAVALLLVAIAAAPTRSSACWWWSNSTKSVPIPENTFNPNKAAGSGQGSIGWCQCADAAAHAGGLYKTDQGVICAYTDTNTWGLSYCFAGAYQVLVQDFVTSGNPHAVNSTAADPTPAGVVPTPAGSAAEVYLCAGPDSNLAGDGQLVAGALAWDPNGDRSCLVSKSFGIGGLSGYIAVGQYQALVGTKCLLPP